MLRGLMYKTDSQLESLPVVLEVSIEVVSLELRDELSFVGTEIEVADIS